MKKKLSKMYLITLLILCGCQMQKKEVKPNSQWKSFTLSQTGSSFEHNFWYTIEKYNDNYYVTAEFVTKDGIHYVNEEGICLDTELTIFINELNLDVLPEKKNEISDELLLDAIELHCILIYDDNRIVSKSIDCELADQMIERLNSFLDIE